MPEPPAQFVLLRHVVADSAHWDLMLDTGETLATWQLHDDPTSLLSKAEGATVIRAQQIGDHRRAYLQYEGPVSGNRGYVTRVDAGPYEAIERRPNVWHVRLNGRILRGAFHLTKNPDESWSFRRLSGS